MCEDDQFHCSSGECINIGKYILIYFISGRISIHLSSISKSDDSSIFNQLSSFLHFLLPDYSSPIQGVH